MDHNAPIEENLKKKQFRKSHSAYMDDVNKFMGAHRAWRKWTQSNRKGFFPVFSPEFTERMKDVSGNALKLYIYLGAHIDNQAGYTLLSVETMAEYFETSPRTVHNWLRELKKHKLIIRIQPAFKQPTLTFLLPYHDEYIDDEYRYNLKNLIREYNGEEEDHTTTSELQELIENIRKKIDID